MFATDLTPHPMERRVAAAQATLDRYRDHPFAWGKCDCVRVVAFHLRAMGYKPRLAKAGAYRSAASAVAALKRAGFASLADAMDSMGFERIAPAATLVGDIVEGPAEHKVLGALGVQLGNGRTLGYHPHAEGAAVLQPSEWKAAWRVEPWANS